MRGGVMGYMILQPHIWKYQCQFIDIDNDLNIGYQSDTTLISNGISHPTNNVIVA